MKALPLVLLAVALLAPGNAPAQEPLEFATREEEQRFADLTHELRCLVCQNQNLADSDAPLAHDLREEIHRMMRAGRTDDEIKSFMVDRYGEFVLYRPPVAGRTLALWLTPAVLLLIGALVVVRAVRRQAPITGELHAGELPASEAAADHER